MSSRQLRKLQQQKTLERTTSQESAESEEIEETAPQAAKPRPNLFAALGGEDEGETADQDDDEDGLDKDTQAVPKDAVEDQPAVIETKSKKKKKKKKKAKKVKEATAQDEVTDNGEEGEDEIDRAIKALKIQPQHGNGTSETAPVAENTSRTNQLLTVNPYHLKAVHEMRNLFGKEVIQSANAEEEQERGNRRRDAVHRRQVDLETFLEGDKKLPEVSLRRNVFIQGREQWPRQSAGGLTMKEVEKTADWTEYTYVHDKDYDGMQSYFFACVQIGDPMRMVHLLKRAPYHVSTLLQVSSVAKQDQNMSLAADLCERALFTFGRVTTSAFRQNIEQGRARFDFRRPENRQFWLAGYHYLRSLIRKGTYRTGLEWAKLLYVLDSGDPYAMRHYIHFLAVRAHESQWLVEFLNEIEKTSQNRDTVYLRQTIVLAKLQLGDVEGARQDLANGLRRVPWLYCALFQELNLDTPPSIWGIGSESNERSFWTKLYIHQTKELWNNTQATTILQEVAKGLDKVDVSLLPVNDPAPDLGATRLAYLEGQTSLLAVAPREILDSQPNYDFDPLPPAEEDNIFTGEGTQLPWRDQQSQMQGRTNEVMQQMENLMARQAVARGGFGGGEEDEDDMDAINADDEELRRDIEAHAARANEPGMLGTLLQMFGLGGGRQAEQEGGHGHGDEYGSESEAEAEQRDAEGLPGAWPDNGGGGGEAGGRR